MPSTVARVVLLAGPTVLAFFTGGYFPEAQAWAGLVAWVLVAVALVGGAAAARGAAGASGSRRAACVLLAAWTLASIAWAPIAGSAYHAGQLVLLYAGALRGRGAAARRSRDPAVRSSRRSPPAR